MNNASDRRLLTRIALRNYKSIRACDVRPAQLSFLVGPNGSGKSNFLDALRFVAEALRFSLDHALRDRGGIQEVRRRSVGHPNHFGITLEFQLSESAGRYSFLVGAQKGGGYIVQREECTIGRKGAERDHYEVREGVVTSSTLSPAPAAASDRLYLVNVSGLAVFRPLYDALSAMGVYNLNPDQIRDLQPPDPGDQLKRDGSNLASVLAKLETHAPQRRVRIQEYLGKVVPGVTRVESRVIGPKRSVEFWHEMSRAKQPGRLLASNMSDGTLRTLGVLTALFQASSDRCENRRLVGIEEPESTLHPAAAGILNDALHDASDFAQILVTCHGSDLLDNKDNHDASILVAVSEHGETRIGPPDESGRSVLRDHLYTAGELLRMDQLRPDRMLSEPKNGANPFALS